MSNLAVTQNRSKAKPDGRNNLWKRICYNKYFYILFLPVFLYFLIFSYKPMYGIILAFKKFDYSKGILTSPWAEMNGFQHFYSLLSDAGFKYAFMNTLVISIQRIIFEFPVPIILALLLNELKANKLKRLVQTVVTFPHFLSWIVVTGIFFNLLSDIGVVNEILAALGFEKIPFLTQTSTFRGLLYFTSNWKETGWGTIIYLAAISNINVELYEAAIVDGAKRFQLLRYITWPAILSVIGIMLVLSISSIMNAGFDQIFNMYNAAVYRKADIIDTYLYRKSFAIGSDFAYSTAVGLFKSVINFMMLIGGNILVKRLTGKSIY